ncbi:MAG TPA: DUF3857 and transglutaminase domain-containing protein [Puia sp.]|nr:DUF3857 and transglutaminase domain-containing protein [Puia sp.]
MTFGKFTLLILLGLGAGTFKATAQEKSPARFGKITSADFDLSKQKFDSGAAAVVIADIGGSEFVGNVKGWFSLEFKHYKRIKILNKNGFDAANIEIPLYISGADEEKLVSLKAVTYNLENGKVVETRLEDKSVFTDNMSKHWKQKKFTFPALKEGSIIEYSYTQSSDFLFNLQPWQFQGEYSCLWSEYQVGIPDFFQYVTLSQGFLPYDLNTSSSRNVSFHITFPGGAERDENETYEDNVVDHRWVMKNVPPLKEEKFTTTLNNYVAKIEFQIARYRFRNSMIKDIMGNWPKVSEELMKSDDFGADLNRNNGWLDDDMKVITKGAANSLQKAQKIYAYVRDNFTCTNHYAIYAATPIKTVFKNKNGNVAEINLLLAAMLNHEKIQADPVILSTRTHGFTHEIYPLLTRFNYVICQARIDSSVWYLDASETWLGFGHIPERCYNGHARVISKDNAAPAYFEADSVMETSRTTVFISNESKGSLSGAFQTIPGYFESCTIREKVKDKGEKEYFKALQTSYPGETTFSNSGIDSLKIPEQPLGISYNFAMKVDSSEDLFYFNPLLTEGYKENPFKAAERRYPVEMSNAFDDTYVFNMEIPDGYAVEELPKSAKVLFNDDEGFFEYLIAKDDNNIQLRSRIRLNKATYKQEDYATLRDFFAFVVKKQSEQIVFKKKK